MDSALILITIILLVGFATVIYTLNRKLSGGSDATVRDWLKNIDSRLDNQNKTINESLFKQTQQMLQSQQAIYGRLAESAKTIGEIGEIGKSMKDLQQFLASPKLRGGMGEQVLRQLLEDSLPKSSFNLQYTFRNGTKVDAAIKTASGIIPIDSKFTLENFKVMMGADNEGGRAEARKKFTNDTKDRIEEISKKYILTDEGTVDFALMYVPSESVYYEIVNSDQDLMAYAYKRRVMPVSPSTFFAFLRSVMLSLEGQQIAAEIKSIQQALRAIHQETGKFGELLGTLQSHINNSYAMMTKIATSFAGLSSKVENVNALSDSKEKKLEDSKSTS